MNQPPVSIRVTAFAAAFVVTALVTASQLGLADHYTAAADAQLTAQHQSAPFALLATPAAAQRKPG